MPLLPWLLNRHAARSSSRSREIVDRLDVRPGQSVADIGAGGGYFTYEFARRVGPTGAVYAVDVKLSYLDAIRREALRRGLQQVVPVFVRRGDFVLPEGAIDLVFMRDVVHHLPDPAAVFNKLRHHLSDGGRIAVIDFKARRSFGRIGHFIEPEKLRSDLDRWGYRLIHDWDFIPHQHFMVFAPKQQRKDGTRTVAAHDLGG
jgi:arsenite methyltransferase